MDKGSKVTAIIVGWAGQRNLTIGGDDVSDLVRRLYPMLQCDHSDEVPATYLEVGFGGIYMCRCGAIMDIMKPAGEMVMKPADLVKFIRGARKDTIERVTRAIHDAAADW